ncbi:hypothetical protein RCOM_0524510 [Ricinus communis]|uniref:Uncharacterized protein n=1 Tax=Ricinus communis TaxID=3988 RepID=B9SJB5_RICCO|nr:hypothetical protein RCOM_0524510 [Ricinus communis]|eukprot:XP_015579007.1 BAG family molecular chaperone regulator 8, chloroplastic [Ricinus communis]
MASLPHHHHPSHHHHCQPPVPSAPITTTTCCCCTCHYNNRPSPPLQQLSIDPLLQSLAYLLQQQEQQSPNLSSPYSNNKPHLHKNHNQRLHFQPQKFNFQHLSEEQDQDTNSFILSSLLQRIKILESSLQQFSVSNRRCHHSYSLRETAARVIQTHFRAFLVRRSRTLSQLQDLASIKSSFNAMKSSVLNNTHLSHAVVSHRAMGLLLKIDSIQGGDPIIRDGKKSISRDIVRFLDFIDGLPGKGQGSSLYKPVKNVRFIRKMSKSRASNSNVGYEDLSRNQKEIVENLSERVEKIRGFSRVYENDEEDVELEGFQELIDDDEDEENIKVSKIRNGILVKSNGSKPRVKKSVSFDEDGNVYRIFSDTHESVLNGDGSFTDGSDSSDDHGETLQKDEVVQEENPASSQSSDAERNHVRNSRSGEYYEISRYCQDQDGNLVFSAPMPVKMESRADLMKKRKAVKIVT